jgi:hypothetical protein
MERVRIETEKKARIDEARYQEQQRQVGTALTLSVEISLYVMKTGKCAEAFI